MHSVCCIACLVNIPRAVHVQCDINMHIVSGHLVEACKQSAQVSGPDFSLPSKSLATQHYHQPRAMSIPNAASASYHKVSNSELIKRIWALILKYFN